MWQDFSTSPVCGQSTEAGGSVCGWSEQLNSLKRNKMFQFALHSDHFSGMAVVQEYITSNIVAPTGIT
jgi:hypothetical protein